MNNITCRTPGFPLPRYRDTVIQVSLSAIAENVRRIRELIGPDVALAAVVKANGYGHGAAAIAPVLMENGASLLAVATLDEALELKACNPAYPVLVMGLTPDAYLPHVVRCGITQTIDTVHQAELLNRLAKEEGRTAAIHLKIDTGFHRIGFPDTDASIRALLSLRALPHLYIEGIFSHLALLDDASNLEQYRRFTRVVNALEAEGFSFRYKHIADSIALVDYPQYRMNLVRAGALIYGLRGFHKGFVGVRQSLTFRTRLCHITDVKKGEGVSYDYAWRAPKDLRVGTLPFGYADGYPRCLRDKGEVEIRGVRCPLVGVLCMDQCMVDLSAVPDAAVGDEAVIYGDGTGCAPDIQEISQLAATNKNEIVARLSLRPPRIYVTDAAPHTP